MKHWFRLVSLLVALAFVATTLAPFDATAGRTKQTGSKASTAAKNKLVNKTGVTSVKKPKVKRNTSGIGAKMGTKYGKRGGKAFTPAGKRKVVALNKKRNGGTAQCEGCKLGVIPAKKSQKGVTPPKNEIQIDHICPKSCGGDGDVSNGQVLCRGCNRKKSDK